MTLQNTERKYDLIVAGGGLSGAAAAISAAREGLGVLLIERANCLGGAASNCLVNPFMPYWTVIRENGAGKKFYLCGGVFREILGELEAAGALAADESAFSEEYLKLILNRMVKKAGADILFHSYLTGVSKDGETLVSVTVANKSGTPEFFADYFVDATGDADLAVMSGCPYRLGRDADRLCQPMTLCFRVGNVDMDGFAKSRGSINTLYAEMQKQGKIRNVREDVLIFEYVAEGVLHFNSTRIVKKNPVDAFDLTEAEIEAREQVFELYDFLVKNIGGFQNSRLLATAPQIGVRESRMIDGEYVLTGGDLISCKKFADTIAVGNYDIDIHNPEGSGTSHHYFPEGQYYGIPYRALLPRNAANLLVAGRCISVTHEAQASIRIMPIVCCVGEAAGTAAGVARRAGVPVRDVDTEELRDILRKRGSVV
ncbi:MAG: FAD-dependent oxidoreductase [Firmicutes bacterium]|nr:FAD-dependent oxidoreductase [Bacillota bacterium]